MMRCLDTPKPRPYKSRPLWVAALLMLWGPVALGETVLGAQLPDGAQKVGQNRYRVVEDWEAILKYYKTVYSTGQFPRKPIVNQPGIKAIHITNPSGKGFLGLNIYEANDEVRIYILPAPPPPPPKPTKKKK
jgi:hypothetical protein